ncbi:M48 family metallopeptidase [Rhodobacteraceae bacterium 2376]|uniref:M48 family metallopeptidase n=1 Tax=Rhabdonatronobacter sediminivivens TaxID=2743469 RepID=A0A7Z0HYF5_9RHOB|nr:SprT family zinc-dependent metalloprotease [Rhabdonatronobacter sediminivivens]NYS24567.1 M48 family metallopeptidase [Rhabdonatronobacter sediminivivens]
MVLTRAVLPGDPPLEVDVRRRAQARRMSLRVSHPEGHVTLSIPTRLDDAIALAFLREKEPWLRSTLARLPERVQVAPGARLPVRGQLLTLTTGPQRGIEAAADALILPADPSGRRSGPRLAAWLKMQAQADLAAACARHATRLGRPHGAIVLRDTRSRWGSCSSAARLMFSWRLVMAPPAVLDYVAAHEVAHLAEMNHSRAFWAHVERLYPGYQHPRDWLRRNGHGLHRFDFTPPDAAQARA